MTMIFVYNLILRRKIQKEHGLYIGSDDNIFIKILLRKIKHVKDLNRSCKKLSYTKH